MFTRADVPPVDIHDYVTDDAITASIHINAHSTIDINTRKHRRLTANAAREEIESHILGCKTVGKAGYPSRWMGSLEISTAPYAASVNPQTRRMKLFVRARVYVLTSKVKADSMTRDRKPGVCLHSIICE